MSNEQASEFGIVDFINTPREEFAVDEDVQATLKAMLERVNRFCLDNKIPFVASAVVSCDGNDYHLSSSINFPLGRFPEELLVMNEVIRAGIPGMLALLEVFREVYSKKEAGLIIA